MMHCTFHSQLGKVYALSNRPSAFKSTLKREMVVGGLICEMHVARVGVFKGYDNGEFELTRRYFDNLIHNFEQESNPVPVYRGHADMMLLPTGEEPTASGWILGLKRKGDDLWASVQLTKTLEKQIREGEFRFTSIYVKNNQRHRETGENIGSRLASLAVTNQPFIDGLEEIQLSDSIFGRNQKLGIYKSKDLDAMSESTKKDEVTKLLEGLKESNPDLDLSLLDELVELVVEEDAKDQATDTTIDLPIEVEEDGDEEIEASDVDPEKKDDALSDVEDKKDEEEVAASELGDDVSAMLEELRGLASEKAGEELDLAGTLEMLKSMLEMKEELTGEIGLSNMQLALSAVKGELTKERDKSAKLRAKLNKYEDEKVESWALSQVEKGLFHASKKDEWKRFYKSDRALCLSILADKKPEIVLSQIVNPSEKDAQKASDPHASLSDHEKKILEGARITTTK